MALRRKTEVVKRTFIGDTCNEVEDAYIEWAQLRGKTVYKASWCQDFKFYLEIHLEVPASLKEVGLCQEDL